MPGSRSSSFRGSLATGATVIPVRSIPSWVSGTTTSASVAPLEEGDIAPGGAAAPATAADDAGAGEPMPLRIRIQVPPAPATSTVNTTAAAVPGLTIKGEDVMAVLLARG